MKRAFVFAVSLTLLAPICAQSAGSQKAQSPTEAAMAFYRALKEKHYLEGFKHSVYRAAVEGLTPAEMSDLEPEFARTFARIPEKIEAGGEEIKGDTATVTLRFEGLEELQVVALVHVGGEWLVGDREALAEVKRQGRAYFFNARMLANEDETVDLLAHLVGAQVIYGKKYPGRCATLEELIRLGGVPREIESGQASGYHLTMLLSVDQSSFTASAVPLSYGKTGRLSFYADLNGIRAQDLKGQPATKNSPPFQPK